jgi:hypothetical protein
MKTLFPVLFLYALSAHATLNVNTVRGKEIIRIQHSGKSSAEICVIPNHFPAVKYSDKDEQNEKELCEMDVHAPKGDAACAKGRSTNPAIEIFEVPEGQTKASVEAKWCANESKIAKYKMSTSCSYTPAILAYYHLSRVLGGAADVPVSVLRTMDKGFHLGIAKDGYARTAGRGLIHETWGSVVSNLQKPLNRLNELYLTDNQSQTYGALSKNPKNEGFYSEFFNKGLDRAAQFRDHNLYYQSLNNPQPLNTFVGTNISAANLQKVVALKDMSEMIILDHIMSQADRFGNTNYIEYYYYPKQGANGEMKWAKTKVHKAPPEIANNPNAMKIKDLLLKDNDCGGAKKTNIAKKAGLINGIRHMNKQTYHRLLWLQSILNRPETKKFLFEDILFTPADFTMFETNLKEVVTLLQSRCRAGQLQLDLDPQMHFFGKYQPSKDQCEWTQ